MYSNQPAARRLFIIQLIQWYSWYHGRRRLQPLPSPDGSRRNPLAPMVSSGTHNIFFWIGVYHIVWWSIYALGTNVASPLAAPTHMHYAPWTLNAFVSILSYALLRFTSIERYSMLLKNSSSRRRNYLRMWIVFIATSRPWRFHHYPLPYRLVLISPQPPRVLVWRHDELLNSRTKRANIGVDEQLIIGERYIGSM